MDKHTTPEKIISLVDSGVPQNKAPAKVGTDLGDEAMMPKNAHPHQEHSAGYGGDVAYENHGFEAFHVRHGARDKQAEHLMGGF